MALTGGQRAPPCPRRFIGEEQTAANGGVIPELTDAPTWMVDPVDGTTNFVHGQPMVCTSIGLAVGKRCVVGVVFNPILDEFFEARLGGGALLNGRPVHVSPRGDLRECVVGTEIGIGRDEETLDAMMDRIRKVTKEVRGIRGSGSCAINMCSVAMGRADAMFEINIGGPWDVGAGGESCCRFYLTMPCLQLLTGWSTPLPPHRCHHRGGGRGQADGPGRRALPRHVTQGTGGQSARGGQARCRGGLGQAEQQGAIPIAAVRHSVPSVPSAAREHRLL